MEYEELRKKHKQEIIDGLKRIYTDFVFGDYSKEAFMEVLNIEIDNILFYLKLL